ncbi:hypothetical protein C1646_773523 [Rhizophagus diaphanus]|nr:hypothetical protein C1646_773523 [Rhizophagus diaphanus] [Rhizophagus sp. MUCL 43196]
MLLNENEVFEVQEIKKEESSDLMVVNPVTELQLLEQLVSEHIGLTFSNEYFLAYIRDDNLEDMASEETEEEIPKPKSVN